MVVLAATPRSRRGRCCLAQVCATGCCVGALVVVSFIDFAVLPAVSDLDPSERSWDFVMCLGDERTDESMFAALANVPCACVDGACQCEGSYGENSVLTGTLAVAVVDRFTCTVGRKMSLASSHMDSPDEVLSVLNTLTATSGGAMSPAKSATVTARARGVSSPFGGDALALFPTAGAGVGAGAGAGAGAVGTVS